MGWVSKKIRASIEQEMKTDSYWIESAKLDFALELHRACQKAGINGKTLAEKFGKSAAYISRVFRGDSNLTLESMVKLARASGNNIEIKFVDVNAQQESPPVTKFTNNVIALPSAYLGKARAPHIASNANAWINGIELKHEKEIKVA